MKCKDCNEEMNPVEAMLSVKHGVCGKCTRKRHEEATGASPNPPTSRTLRRTSGWGDLPG